MLQPVVERALWHGGSCAIDRVLQLPGTGTKFLSEVRLVAVRLRLLAVVDRCRLAWIVSAPFANARAQDPGGLTLDHLARVLELYTY